MANMNRRGTSVSKARKTGLLNNPAVKACADKVILAIIEELDNLPIDPKTGTAYRGSAKKIIDEYLEMHHWLTRFMILSKRKQMRRTAEAQVAINVKKKGSNSKQVALEDLQPISQIGRKKGKWVRGIRWGEFLHRKPIL